MLSPQRGGIFSAPASEPVYLTQKPKNPVRQTEVDELKRNRLWALMKYARKAIKSVANLGFRDAYGVAGGSDITHCAMCRACSSLT
ncbi:hypothetical protein MCEMSEM22_03407 [Comamonadaceae bacterium]